MKKGIEDSRESFQNLPIDEQMMIVYDMMSYVRSTIAVMEKDEINFREEQRQYRTKRERREDAISLTTSKKIEKILSGKFDFWVWFRDRILPSVITLIVIALLYVAFTRP